MKRLFIVVMCALVILVCPHIDASAAEAAGYTAVSEYVGSDTVMRSDVIKYVYREYKGRLQYRRWNSTRGYWVDPDWIYV